MKNKFKRVLLSIASAGLLTIFGCGGGGGGSAASNPSSSGVLVSGVASKGPLNGSTVCAYAIVNNVKSSALGACATNIVNGNYSIDIGTYTGPVLFEATGGTYIDEATGTAIALASPLRSIIGAATGSKISVAITPLTELAYKDANSVAEGLTSARIQAAIASVQTNFGVSDIVNTQPVDALNVPEGATAEQKTYALALATVSQYQNGQPNGTSLVDTLQSIRACLADSNGCGTGATSIGSNLNAAMKSAKAKHPAFSGLNLPVSSLGAKTDSTAISITVAGLNDPKHKGILQNGTLVIGTYGGIIDTLLGKVEITSDGAYSLPKATSGATLKRIIQQPAGQVCQFTKLRQNHFDPYTQQLITEFTSDIYCYESPCGSLVSLGQAPAPQELKPIWNPDSTVTLKWKPDAWANSYHIYYGTNSNVVVNDSVTGFAHSQYEALAIDQSGSKSISNLDSSKDYYFAISSMYSSPSNVGSCQSSASTVVSLPFKNIAPTFISMSPSSGVVGTLVTITGTNFDATPVNNEVLFNGVKATVINSTATSLTVTVPSGAKTGKLTITTGGGIAISTGDFTVSVPVVNSISPTTANLNQLTTFTVRGSNFVDGMSFALDGCIGNEVMGVGTSTMRQFTCSPTLSGQNNGQIKDKIAGAVLNSFYVAVDSSLCTKISSNYPYNKYCYYLNSSGIKVYDGLYEEYQSALGDQLTTQLSYKDGVLNGPAKAYDKEILNTAYKDVYFLKYEGQYTNGQPSGTWRYYSTNSYGVGVDSLGKLNREVTWGILFNGSTIDAVDKSYCPYGPGSAYAFPPSKAGKLASTYTRDLSTGEQARQLFFKTGCNGPD